MMLEQKASSTRVPFARRQSGKHRAERSDAAEDQKPVARDSELVLFGRTKKSECVEKRGAKDERDRKVRCSAM